MPLSEARPPDAATPPSPLRHCKWALYILRPRGRSVVVLLLSGPHLLRHFHLPGRPCLDQSLDPGHAKASTGSATPSGGSSHSWFSSAYLGPPRPGHFGHSYIQNRAVLADWVLERFPATLQLALAGLFVALAIGLPLGVFAATHKG